MKKLSLALDELSVESFDTSAPSGRRGTVEGRSSDTYADMSCGGTCNGTCYPASCASCAITCEGSCASGCGSCATVCGGVSCGSTCEYATCAQPETCWMNIC